MSMSQRPIIKDIRRYEPKRCKLSMEIRQTDNIITPQARSKVTIDMKESGSPCRSIEKLVYEYY